MAFTRQQISEMREAQLQKDVLIPLFKAMKFRGVNSYGGGSLELGKDVVMWKEEQPRERVNYGVVVKAERISGKATGKGSANEVYFQIMQCLNEPYPDFISTEEQHVHRCWVVSSAEIPKEAVNAIKGQLRSNNLDKVTTFIDGDELWELVQEYMPESGIVEQLDTVRKKLDDLIRSEHYRVTANTKNEFFIETKYPGAEAVQPLIISTRLEFDENDPDAQKALQEWQHHVKTGAPVTVKSPYLREFNIPEFLRPLIDPDPEKMELVLGQMRSVRKIPFKFELLSHDGEVATLEYVEFEVIQQGMEEVTLRNERQSVPWRVTFVSNNKNRQFKFTFNFKFARTNVKQALQALRFQNAMTKAGDLRIENLENGITIREAYSPTGQDTVSKFWLNLLDEMAFIQRKTSIPLHVPDEPITPQQVQGVHLGAEALRTGRATFTAKHIPVVSTVKQVIEALESYGGDPPAVLTLHMQENQQVNVFGVDIPLGPVFVTCDKFHIAKSELAKVRRRIENSGPEETVEYRITLDGPLEARYINWLPTEEADAVSKLLDDRPEDTHQPITMAGNVSEQIEAERSVGHKKKRPGSKKSGGKRRD